MSLEFGLGEQGSGTGVGSQLGFNVKVKSSFPCLQEAYGGLTPSTRGGTPSSYRVVSEAGVYS